MGFCGGCPLPPAPSPLWILLGGYGTLHIYGILLLKLEKTETEAGTNFGLKAKFILIFFLLFCFCVTLDGLTMGQILVCVGWVV